MSSRPVFKSGFSFLELFIVISIITIIAGMLFTQRTDNPEAAVHREAIKLKRVLIKARNLAKQNFAHYTVVFHIENSGDGSVLKNYSQIYEPASKENSTGRHWYAIIGPSKGTQSKGTRISKDPPAPGAGTALSNLQLFRNDMEVSQIGGRNYLSPGVRFLALSDQDRGNAQLTRNNITHSSYPRAWFGYYDESEGTYYPWGGYDVDIDEYIENETATGAYRPKTDRNSWLVGGSWGDERFGFSGFVYENVDGEIPYDADLDTNIHPNAVHGVIHAAARRVSPKMTGVTSNSTAAPDVGGHPDSLIGTPRPLFDGYTGGFSLIFTPHGHCLYSKLGRAYYKAAWKSDYFKGGYDAKHESFMGGVHITLARDIDPDEEIYTVSNPDTNQPDYRKISLQDAYRSIKPFRRVFVSFLTGIPEIKDMEHPDCVIEPEDLTQRDPYPYLQEIGVIQ